MNQRLRLGTPDPALLSGTGLGADDFVHEVLPGPGGDFGIGGGQINSGNLEIQNGLPDRFVLRVEQRERFRLIFRAETRLLARFPIVAIEDAASLEQNKLLIHKQCLRAYES